MQPDEWDDEPALDDTTPLLYGDPGPVERPPPDEATNGAAHLNGDTHEEWPEVTPALAPAPSTVARFVSLAEFVSTQEQGVDALLGNADSIVIPEGGDVMVYGDGGAGKTTLTIDAAFHLAAGDDWLGLRIGRPVRVAIIENEGPRPLFRKKLERKRASWEGSDLADRLHILEHPWATFTFANENHRAWLAAEIDRLAIDIVIAGPLTRIGMNEAGTLQQTRDFTELLGKIRTLTHRPTTFLLIHHENKGGQVSGAWEGAGDTLLHVQGRGHGRTQLVFQKARWASDWHGKSLALLWAAGEGFTVSDAPERDDAEIADELIATVRANGGSSWNVIEKTMGGNASKVREIRDQLLDSGLLIDANAERPTSRRLLWDVTDPTRPLRLDEDETRTN